MIGDLLLLWMSETGAGSITRLRDRAQWLARTADLRINEYATGRWLRDASALGHCELDWNRDQWSIAPAAITRLPDADATAVLAGARRQHLLGTLEEALDTTGAWGEKYTRAPGEGHIPPPTTVMIQFDSTAQLRALAEQVGAQYAGCAATGIIRHLPATELGVPAAPPVATSPLEVLSTTSPRTFVPAAVLDARRGDGLYRQLAQGRHVHLYRSGGQWHHCDLSTGVFLELQRRGVSATQWRPEPGPGRGHTGTFLVEAGVPLPALHERALVLCSGFPGLFHSSARALAYANIPLTVARAVAASLGQPLQLLPHAEGRTHD